MFQYSSGLILVCIIGAIVSSEALPWHQVDHGTMVFQCQTWLTMMLTMVSNCDHIWLLTMAHSQLWSYQKHSLPKLSDCIM